MKQTEISETPEDENGDYQFRHAAILSIVRASKQAKAHAEFEALLDAVFTTLQNSFICQPRQIRIIAKDEEVAVSQDEARVPIPFTATSLSEYIFDAWFENAKQQLSISRFLFEQAFLIYPAMQDEIPSFGDSEALMRYSIKHFDRKGITLSDHENPKLLNLLFLHSAQELFSSASDEDSNKAAFQAALNSFLERELNQISEQLVVLANSAKQESGTPSRQQSLAIKAEAACKLLLHLAEPEWIGRIELNSLSLIDEPVGEKVMRKLKFLKALETLNLSQSYFPSESLEQLSYLPLLYHLDLSNTRTSNNGIVLLKNSASLEFLDISSTLINAQCSTSLRKFKRLKTLKCDENIFPQESITDLKAAGVEVQS